jgi:hypothetical protein
MPDPDLSNAARRRLRIAANLLWRIDASPP